MRYFTRAHTVTNLDDVSVTANTVFCEENPPRDTGLIDADGMTIYSVPDTVPLGFHHHKPTVRVRAGRKTL